MNEKLFEIETWRGGWFYKFGSRYTGPFLRRVDAITAANRDLSPLKPLQTTPRASLGQAVPVSGQHGVNIGAELGIGAWRRN